LGQSRSGPDDDGSPRQEQHDDAYIDAPLHASHERLLIEAENLQRALAINFMYYTQCRKHMTIRSTPAIKAGLTDSHLELHDLAKLVDAKAAELA
jgi:hypothetical protein